MGHIFRLIPVSYTHLDVYKRQPYILTKHLLQEEGKASRKVGEEALLEWGEAEYFEPFAGMTTRNVVKRLKPVSYTHLI